ncbi:MAG: ROK family protein, partial [Candidatus Omnitrophica bacterium]|nr:ROK family protein [Candidatus Omnitrophota bacterium]
EYGDGISCGIISDGRVIHGIGGVAGEFGHIKIVGRDEICKCGKKGCLESIASVPNILNNIKAKTGKMLDIYLVLEKYKSGEPEIKKIIDEIFEIFAVSIGNLINLFNPEMIIFDKNFLIFKDFFDLIFGKIKANMVYNYPIKIEISNFGEEIGAIGGACLSMRHRANAEEVFLHRFTHLPLYDFKKEDLKYMADSIIEIIEEMQK